MARNSPEQAVRRRTRSQAARPRSDAAAWCSGGARGGSGFCPRRSQPCGGARGGRPPRSQPCGGRGVAPGASPRGPGAPRGVRSARDAGPQGAGQRGREPGWDGRGAGGRTGTGPNGRGASPRGAGDGPPTRRLPAQPDETQPARTRQATGPRARPAPGVTAPARPPGARDGSARDVSGPREARGRRNPRRSPGAGRWGALQGGLGVCIIVASAAFGTIATILTRSAPGFLLGVFVEAGTVVAALAVRPRTGRMIFPVPVLSYLVGALISGFVFNRSGTSKTALAIGAAQWVANGFFAMALATVLAVAIITIRWYLWRRGRTPAREVGRDADWAAPPRRSHAAWEQTTESGYPAAPRTPEGPRGQRAQPGGRTQPSGQAQPGTGAQPGRRAQGGRRGPRGLGRRGPTRCWLRGGLPPPLPPARAGAGPGRGREPVPTTSPAGRSGVPGA